MPNPINVPITPPRVAFIDPRSGNVSREWYMFFLSLFALTSGSSQSLDDVQKGPPPLTVDEINAFIEKASANLQPSTESVIEQIAELQKQINGLQSQIECCDSSEVEKQIQALEVQTRDELGTLAALQQDNVPWLTFNNAPSPVPTAVGSMYWDGGTTMGVQATANVLIRLGEAEYVYAKASAAITKGQLCYHTGAVGASGVITAAPTPLALVDPNQIVGVAAESIALNGFGLIQVSGDLRGFNTTGSSVGETWADGDPLYYNPAYVGSMTKTKPSAPNQKTYIGEVINAATSGSGSMSIRITPGSVLGGTDSNVQFSSVANGDLLQYDSTLQYWKNVPSSTFGTGSVTSVSVVSANGFAGSVATATTTPAITLSTSISGLLYGNGTAVAATTVSAPLTYSAGTLAITQATTSTNGYLSSTDWNTFNAKQPAGTYVTSVTGTSPVASSGGTTPAISLSTGYGDTQNPYASKTANYVLAAPSGSAGVPSFRALVAADIPALSYVNSVGATAPITSTGGLTPTIGVTSAALTKTDDTNVTMTLGGSPTTALLAATSLTLGWTGQLAVSRGGTGVSTATANTIFAGPTSGAAAAPSFRALVAGDIPSLPYQPTAAPVTYTANFSVATTDVWIINNKSGSSCTATLPAASSYSGRVLRFQNYQAQTLVSASSNVVPIAGGAAGTAILAAVAGDTATLVSDGTNWIIMQYVPNNILLLE